MTAAEIVSSYLSFFEKREHKQIQNSSLIPENDPTTLFTSSGMQPLIPFLLGEEHASGKRLVNVQNCFRAQDIDEIGDNRHTTFFRMLGNWSFGDYFKKEQLPWFFEFLVHELQLDPNKLYVTVFEGNNDVPEDKESIEIWKEQFKKVEIDAKIGERIFKYGVEKNWWSRAGSPEKMPVGEPGGPDSEVFYDLGSEQRIHENSIYKNQTCHPNCDCGRFLEIGNSVFMQYKKISETTFEELPKRNVDFGGGLERLIAATEDKSDIFKTSLFMPIINSISKVSNKSYEENKKAMRIIADHFIAGVFIAAAGVYPSNKEQGYILRRLLRRGFDNYYQLGGSDISKVIEQIVEQYKDTDEYLVDKFEIVRNVIFEEEQSYKNTRANAIRFIEKKYGGRVEITETPMPMNDEEKGDKKFLEIKVKDEIKVGDELMGIKVILPEDAFILYTTHGLSPTQIKSLGYAFDDQAFAEKMKEHQKLSRAGAAQKFSGGLADHEELTVKGHTATHLLHQALRDVLGNAVHQTGSNITSERLRFDFSFDRKLTEDEVKNVEDIVLSKIRENLPVRFEIMSLPEAKKVGAIGLFDEKYGKDVKVYSIGPSGLGQDDYSKEFCGGPHVNFTGDVKSFKIIKEEGAGKNTRRIYAKVT